MANLTLLIVVAAVAVILLILRTNAAMVFFGLCGGSVLVEFANKNMAYVDGHLNSKLLPHNFSVNSSGFEIGLLLAPAIIIAVLLRKSHGPSKMPLEVLPAIATGILGSLLIVPLLSTSAQNHITDNKLWSLLEQYQIPLIGVSVLVCLVVVILEGKTSHKSKHK
ncbi:MAG TPA: hypothetical protein VMR34_00295 [Candidatus Saccharimonadales bacterium]|nr:hypothetical protein [Candidatus Saccharimonadales bacterium]